MSEEKGKDDEGQTGAETRSKDPQLEGSSQSKLEVKEKQKGCEVAQQREEKPATGESEERYMQALNLKEYMAEINRSFYNTLEVRWIDGRRVIM